MPVSRKRKKGSTRNKATTNSPPLYKDKETLRLKPRVFEALRSNEDFSSLIRIGRVMNALTYSIHLLLNPPVQEGAISKRHQYRTHFNAAAYVSEGIEVVQSLRLKYGKEEFFAGLLTLLDDTHKRNREIVRKIRNSVAFHLDSDSKATRAALEQLKLPYYELLSPPTGDGDFYFNLADVVDLNYLIDQFKGSRPEDEVRDEIFKAIYDLNIAFIEGSEPFIEAIGKKLKLIKAS